MQDNKGSGVQPEILDKLKSRPVHQRPERPMQDIAPPIAPELVHADLAKMEVMVDSAPDKPEKGIKVFRAIGSEIPNLVLELGRLREETFRTVGEGSGLSRDVDAFDEYYDQFVAWDKAKKEITGAYRIGRVDEIIKTRGIAGLYTSTFFHYEDSELLTDFKEGTLEAGRSFVRPEYQRGLTLLFIWQGLGAFIVANPHYKHLMGPVSISNEFQESSKHLMIEYLTKHHTHEKSVNAKNPPTFDSNLSPEELMSIVDASMNLKELQEFVRHSEGNPRAQIPQLIKLYLELGVQFLAFNKDDDFNSIDGLIWLEIPNIPVGIGVRYFGEEGWPRYLKYHGKPTT